MSKIKTIFATFILLLAISACNAPTPSLLTPSPTPEKRLPLTEANIPRVTLEDAKAALESGKAIIVDVRSQQAYDMSHVKGAIYIPLADMETNPTGLNLDKNQWIIPYCS